MTILKSRLVTPDGEAIVGRKVTVTLMSRPSWIYDPARGRALGSVTTYTDAEGMWRMTLMPYTEFEGADGVPFVWYQVDEGEGAVWASRFDDQTQERWLKDTLIDVPRPEPDWVAIDKLSSLHDVDRESVVGAPDGAVLIKRGGKWVAEVPTFGKEKLAELDDVDPASMATPVIGDHLRYLGTAGWGISRPPRTWLRWRMEPHPTDPQGGRHVQLTVLSRLTGKSVSWFWDDEPAGDPGTVIGPEVTTLNHVYADTEAGSAYYPQMSYTPDIPGEGVAAYNAGLIIPMSEPVEASNEPKE